MPYLIVEQGTNIIKYAREEEPIIEANRLIYTDFTVLDMGSSNSDLINTATILPTVSGVSDYIGGKYKWEGDNYVLNDSFVAL